MPSPSLYSHPVRAIDRRSRVSQPLPCFCCGGEQSQAWLELIGQWRIVVCEVCGSGWADPMPGAEEIRSFYPAAYYGSDGVKFGGLIERIVRAMTRRQARRLSSGLGRGSRAVDVGCGRGDLVRALARLGFEAHGTELGPVPGLESTAEVHVAEDLAEAGFAAESVDLVVLWHVLEHLPDPTRTLTEVFRIVRPGGRLVVAVPNFSSWQARWGGAESFHLDLPRHLIHFSSRGLRELLARCGFTVTGEESFSLRQNPFGWIQSAMNKIPRLPRNGWYTQLQRRPSGTPSPYSLGTRALLGLLGLLLAPAAVLLSLLAGIFGQGSTMTLIAVRDEGSIE